MKSNCSADSSGAAGNDCDTVLERLRRRNLGCADSFCHGGNIGAELSEKFEIMYICSAGFMKG